MPAATTARPTLAAEPRDVLGKKVARLRRAGRLPGVVFGHGLDSTAVTVDAHDFELLRRRVGPNALVDLSVDGKGAQPVLVHGVQVHPVTRRPLHVDLFLVRMTEELIVDVPLVPIGDSSAVEHRRRDAASRHRVGQDQGAARSPAPVDRVFDRKPRRLRHGDPRS